MTCKGQTKGRQGAGTYQARERARGMQGGRQMTFTGQTKGRQGGRQGEDNGQAREHARGMQGAGKGQERGKQRANNGQARGRQGASESNQGHARGIHMHIDSFAHMYALIVCVYMHV